MGTRGAVYNYEALLEEASALEPEAEIQDQLEEMLDAGLLPPEVSTAPFDAGAEAGGASTDEEPEG